LKAIKLKERREQNQWKMVLKPRNAISSSASILQKTSKGVV
jgi:hypothetical protein